MGKAPGLSLSLRRAFDGGILAIVGVKFMAGIGFEDTVQGRVGLLITNTGQTVTVETVTTTSPLYPTITTL